MHPVISNNEIKRLKSLAVKKFRDSLGLFAVEGEKMVKEAVASGFEVEKIYRKEEIGEDAMARISQLSSPSPVFASVRKPGDIVLKSEDDARAAVKNPGLYLALDSIRDPGNLGTIIRVADWFGLNAVFASAGTVDVFNPKVVQSTMGAIFRVKFHYADLKTVFSCIKENGGQVYGTFLDGENIYSSDLDTGIDCPVVVVTGNESDGISRDIASLVSGRLHIPPFPADDSGSESLNAAVATAITVAEFRRRTYN